jgi:hypothetical protein
MNGADRSSRNAETTIDKIYINDVTLSYHLFEYFYQYIITNIV